MQKQEPVKDNKIEQNSVENVEFYSSIVMNDLNDHAIRGVVVRQDVNNLVIWTTFLVRDFKALEKKKSIDAHNAALSEALAALDAKLRLDEKGCYLRYEEILEGIKIKP